MSQQTESETLPEFETPWMLKGGTLAGLGATIVMGAVISVTDLEMLRVTIAGLYGFEGNLLAGWVAHLIHGALFGAVFGVVLSDPVFYKVNEHAWKPIAVGIVYGLVIGIVGAGIVMPIWLSVVGFQPLPRIPNVTVSSLIWHLVYGTVLGVLFPLSSELWSSGETTTG